MMCMHTVYTEDFKSIRKENQLTNNNNATSHQLIHLKTFHCLRLLDIGTKDK
jgi:hypothetical protein